MKNHGSDGWRRWHGARRRSLLMAVAGLLGLVAAFGTVGASAQGSASASSGTTLVWGLQQLPRTLFVPTDYSTEASWVMVLQPPGPDADL